MPQRAFIAVKEIGSPPQMPDPASFRTNVGLVDIGFRWIKGQEEFDRRMSKAENRNRLALEAAQAKYRTAIRDWEARAKAAKAAYDSETERIRASIKKHNDAVEEHRQAVLSGDRAALVKYFNMVHEASSYPEGFEKRTQFRYSTPNRSLAVDFSLPPTDVIPKYDDFVYDKSRDQVKGRPRSEAESQHLYRQLISSIALRTLDEVFKSDAAKKVDSCSFNGHLATVNPATGETIRPCLVSVQCQRTEFEKLVLDRVDPIACVEGLGGVTSKRPLMEEAVTPVTDFNSVQ